MKTTLFFLSLFLVFCSCEQEGELTQNKTTVIENPQNSTDKFKGTFAPTSGISGGGMVRIYQENNQLKLALENYSIESGPDLKVYLSKTDLPNDFINLGNVNAATKYNIPANTSFSDYKFVLIHCQQYNHLFAIAELKTN